jgi:HEAT repeat protein
MVPSLSLSSLYTGKRTLLFCFLSFLLGFGYVCGFFSANALLVGRIGPTKLFEVYLVSGLFLLPLWGLLYLLVDRFPRHRVFFFCYLLFAFLIVLSWVVLRNRPEEFWIYLGVRVFFYAIDFLVRSLFWLLAGQFFNYFETKRRFPLFLVFDMVGQLLAGLAMGSLASIVHAVNFVLIWAGVLLLCVALVGLLKGSSDLTRVSRPLVETTNPPERRFTFSRSSKGFIAALFIYWSLYALLCNGTDYIFNTMASGRLGDEDKLSSLFGIVGMAAAALVILYQTLFSNLFLNRFGVVGSIRAIVSLMALMLLAVQISPGLLTISIAQAVNFLFLDYVSEGRYNMLLNLFPNANQGRVRVLSEGLGRSVGLISIFVLSRIFGTDARVLFPIILGLACGYAILYPLWFRRSFFQHLTGSLHHQDRNLLSNAVQALGDRQNIKAVSPLLDLLSHTRSVDLKKTIVLSLGRIRSREAFPEIVRLFSSKDEGLRMTVLKALTEYNNYEAVFALLKIVKYSTHARTEVRLNAGMLLTQLVGNRVLPYLIEALLDADPRVRANTIEAMAISKDRKLIPLLRPFLQDPNHRIRANAIIALYPFHASQKEAKEPLVKLLESKESVVRCSALYAIGVLKLWEFRENLRAFLQSEEDKRTILFATFALARLKDSTFCPPFLQLIRDLGSPDAKEALRLMERFPRESILLLLEEITKLPSSEQEGLYKALHQTIPKISLMEEILQH